MHARAIQNRLKSLIDHASQLAEVVGDGTRVPQPTDAAEVERLRAAMRSDHDVIQLELSDGDASGSEAA